MVGLPQLSERLQLVLRLTKTPAVYTGDAARLAELSAVISVMTCLLMVIAPVKQTGATRFEQRGRPPRVLAPLCAVCLTKLPVYRTAAINCGRQYAGPPQSSHGLVRRRRYVSDKKKVDKRVKATEAPRLPSA